MVLLVDIGNTATKIACLKDKEFSYIGRLYNSDINEDNLLNLLGKETPISQVYVSSVAPLVFSKISEHIEKMYGVKLVKITNKINSGVDIAIDNKEELGIDLLCDIVAGINLYGDSLAIVDFGTATKILFIDKNKSFSSCAIFMGYSQSKKILANSTELLPNVSDIDIKPISKCHNTIDVINSSAYYSQLYSIKGIIEKYEQEVGYKVKVVFTGGNATKFIDEFKKENYDKDLVLKGLAMLIERQ